MFRLSGGRISRNGLRVGLGEKRISALRELVGQGDVIASRGGQIIKSARTFRSPTWDVNT